MTTEQHLDAWLSRHYDPLDDMTDIRRARMQALVETATQSLGYSIAVGGAFMTPSKTRRNQ